MPHHFHIEEKRRMICILAALSITIMLFNVVHVRHFLPKRHHEGNFNSVDCERGYFGMDLGGCGDGDGDSGGERMRWLKEWL